MRASNPTYRAGPLVAPIVALVLSSAATLALSAPASAEEEPAPLYAAPIAIPGAYVIALEPGTSAQQTAASVERIEAAGGADVQVYASLGLLSVDLSDADLTAVRSAPNVEFVAQDQVVSVAEPGDGPADPSEVPLGGAITAAGPADAEPAYRAAATDTNATWGLDRIDQPALPLNRAYTYDHTGAGVTTYVIDSGLDVDHRDFTGRVSDAAFLSELGTVEDCDGHGTHVAGTVAGTRYGVARGASIVPVRVLDCVGDGSSSGIISGLDWVARHGSGPRVANLSLGGPLETPLTTAVNRLIATGVSVVAAAGNENVDACTVSPAAAPAVLTVGASDRTDRRAGFSNFGRCVDLYAPGTQITSSWLANGTEQLDGTSMAAPHVAGVAALYLEANPTASPATVTRAIIASAVEGKVTHPRGTTNLLLQSRPLSDPGTGIVPLAPGRVMDTRASGRTVDGLQAAGGAFGAGVTRTLQVGGRHGVPARGVGAVVLNVTALGATRDSHLTVWSSELPRPATSSLNFARHTTVPNLVVTKVDSEGRARIFNAAGNVHVVVDVAGWLPVGGDFRSVTPTRLLDTRGGGQPVTGTPRPARVAGSGTPVPANASAVVLNVTVVRPTDAGHLTLWPSGTTRPTASNLNFTRGETRANLAVVPTGAGGSVDLAVAGGGAHVVLDVVGWFPPDGRFRPVAPARLMDTRATGSTVDGRAQGAGAVTASPRSLPVAGRAGLSTPVRAVFVNVTVVDPSAAGHLTVWPANSPRPTASNLNYAAGQTVPNLVLAKVAPNGSIAIATGAGSAHVVVDVAGWWPR